MLDNIKALIQGKISIGQAVSLLSLEFKYRIGYIELEEKCWLEDIVLWDFM